MTEQQIIDYIKNEFKNHNRSVYGSAKKIGYRPQTIYSWLRCETHITLDGLTDILQSFGKYPVVKDKEGKYHKDILEYLTHAIKGNEKWVYALFETPKYGKDNIRLWTAGKRGIKVCILIEILDVLGAKLTILKRSKNGRTV